MINKKLNDETFEKLVELLEEYVDQLSSRLTSFSCISNIAVIRTFHNAFEKIINKKQLRELTDREIKNKIFNTYHNRLIILLMMESCLRNLGIAKFIYAYGLISYVLLYNKYLPYCDDKVAHTALTFLRPTHSFRKFTSPDIVLKRLSINLERKYYVKGNCNYQNLELMLIHVRTRIARSLKSFVTAYYKAKQSSSSINIDESYRVIADRIATKISTIGYIPKIEACSNIYNNLQKIRDLDYELIYNACYEMLSVIGTRPSKKKVVANIKNLLLVQEICKKINLEPSKQNITCVCLTLIAAGGIE